MRGLMVWASVAACAPVTRPLGGTWIGIGGVQEGVATEEGAVELVAIASGGDALDLASDALGLAPVTVRFDGDTFVGLRADGARVRFSGVFEGCIYGVLHVDVEAPSVDAPWFVGMPEEVGRPEGCADTDYPSEL